MFSVCVLKSVKFLNLLPSISKSVRVFLPVVFLFSVILDIGVSVFSISSLCSIKLIAFSCSINAKYLFNIA